MNIQKFKKQLGFIDSIFFLEQECVIQDFDPNIFKSKNEYSIMIYDSLKETLEFILPNRTSIKPKTKNIMVGTAMETI